MVGITELSALMTSLKGAKDLAESMVGLRDAAAFQGKVIEFQQLVMDAQQRVFSAQEERTALIQKVSELEKKIAGLENWDAEKKRYELKPLGEAGALAYGLKAEMGAGEPMHWICASCYQNAQKSILQKELRFPGGNTFYVCHACGAEVIAHGNRDNFEPSRQSHGRSTPKRR